MTNQLLSREQLQAELQRLLGPEPPVVVEYGVNNRMDGLRATWGGKSVDFSADTGDRTMDLAQFTRAFLQPVAEALREQVPSPETKDEAPFPYEEGDLVRLKSGSPLLTVHCVSEEFLLEVVWFCRGKLKEAALPYWCFEPA